MRINKLESIEGKPWCSFDKGRVVGFFNIKALGMQSLEAFVS
jgi:hypothetical protein